MELLIFHWH